MAEIRRKWRQRRRWPLASAAKDWDFTPSLGSALPRPCHHPRESAAAAGRGPGSVEDLGAGHEHGAAAGEEEQPAGNAGIEREILDAARGGAERDRIDDRPRFEPVLDDEKS